MGPFLLTESNPIHERIQSMSNSVLYFRTCSRRLNFCYVYVSSLSSPQYARSAQRDGNTEISPSEDWICIMADSISCGYISSSCCFWFSMFNADSGTSTSRNRPTTVISIIVDIVSESPPALLKLP